MTIPLWSGIFTNGVSKISAAYMNYVRNSLFKCIDGVGGSEGSEYVPLTPIVINGAGLRTDNLGESTVTGAMTFAAGADIDIGALVVQTSAGTRVPIRLDTTTLGDADVTFNGTNAQADVYHAGSVTVSRTWTISASADNIEGESILVKLPGTPTADVLINSEGGASNPIATFKASPGVAVDNTHQWARFVFTTASGWVFSDAHPNVSP